MESPRTLASRKRPLEDAELPPQKRLTPSPPARVYSPAPRHAYDARRGILLAEPPPSPSGESSSEPSSEQDLLLDPPQRVSAGQPPDRLPEVDIITFVDRFNPVDYLMPDALS